MWLLTFLFFSLSFAHDLEYQISREGKCVVIHFYFPDGTTFSYEKYEVREEKDKLLFQTGRTDALGRLVFCPNRDGVWLVKVSSEDGHGAELKIEVKDGLAVKKASFFEKYRELLAGIGYVLGIFGLLEIIFRRFRL